VAMGTATFEVDLPASRLGWRQVVTLLGGAALVVGVLPWVGAAADGSWGLPDRDFERYLRPVEQQAGDEPFRTVWIGAPESVPLAGRPLDGVAVDPAAADAATRDTRDVHVGVVEGVVPDAVASFVPPPQSIEPVATALRAAIDGDTARVGALLAQSGVRYVVVVDRPGPVPYVGEPVQRVPEVLRALQRQLDLSELDVNPALVVYENAEWSTDSPEDPPALAPASDGRRKLVAGQVAAWVLALALVAVGRSARSRVRRRRRPPPPDAEVVVATADPGPATPTGALDERVPTEAGV
jgi:hypothetical protein